MRDVTGKTPGAVAAIAAFAVALLLAAIPASAAGDETPLAVATRFARAFESQDFATVRALFTPDAMVSRVALSASGEPSFYRFTAAVWTADAERNHVHLRDARLEILDSSTETLEQGAIVSMRYRFSGKAGTRSFVSNGIDTYSLIRTGGEWKVLQYGYLERIEFFAEDKP
ncbi:MAG: nuclear transport factor 2 family protein [Thermoanaerobaculia bacterium]